MNILALDDEKLALSSLKREIHEVFPNDEIICCQNIDDVIEIVKETKNNNQTIDYAFCDIELPQINGVQIAGMLKRYFPKVKILFTTAYSQYALDAFKIKAKGYLLKPIRAKDIIEVLNFREFVSVGINTGIIGEKVYKRAYCSVMIRDWKLLKSTIFSIREKQNKQTLFQDFEILAKRWEKSPLKEKIR